MPSQTAVSSIPDPILLLDASQGAKVRIVAVRAARDEQRRLCEMGLCRGMELSVMGRMGDKGSVVVAAHDSRMVVGADVAGKIAVMVI